VFTITLYYLRKLVSHANVVFCNCILVVLQFTQVVILLLYPTVKLPCTGNNNKYFIFIFRMVLC